MRFEFATATRILFGSGVLQEAGALTAEFGRTVLLVTGAHPERAEPLTRQFRNRGIACRVFPVAGEPTTLAVNEGVHLARQKGVDVVVGFGGGSAMDAAKAIAGMAVNPGELVDYLEVVGLGRVLELPGLPFIAIPTTAGSGAEVTRNAVLQSPPDRVKVSLRSPRLLARLAVVDPTLTRSLPRKVTVSTGLDALNQLIEPFVSLRANPMTDGFCREGMGRVARSLRRVCEVPDDMAAREDMCCASLLGGLSLANAGLGAVHGFAAPIGGMFAAPHGEVCAALLPHVMKANLRALESRAAGHPARERYAEVARVLAGEPSATANEGVEWVRRLVSDLGVSPLREHGITREAFPGLIEKARGASSMKANPVTLTPDELHEVLTSAW